MFGKSFSSALSAIESDEKQTAMSRYLELLHLFMPSSPEVHKIDATPDAVAEMRQIAAKLGKSAADVSRDESIVFAFAKAKDLSRGYGDAEAAREKSIADTGKAQVKCEQEIAAAKSRLAAVLKKEEDATTTSHIALVAQARCHELIQKAPELFRPEDKEYPLIHGKDSESKNIILYQRAQPPAATK